MPTIFYACEGIAVSVDHLNMTVLDVSWDPKAERPVLSKQADAAGAAIRLKERAYGER